MIQKFSGKAAFISEETKKQRKGRRQLLGNCVWLSGRMYIEERRTIERRATGFSESKKTKKTKKTKKQNQNKCNTRERRQGICKTTKSPEDRSSRHLWLLIVNYNMASEPARARLLWAILFLVLPVTFGHTAACRSPALAFSLRQRESPLIRERVLSHT